MAHPPGHGGDDWAAAIVIVNEREIVARIRALLGSSRAHSVVAVGEGSDHWAFDVDGLFIARVRKHRADDDASGIDREVALLDIVARVSPVPVPQVVASEPEAGLMVYRRLHGTSLFDIRTSTPLTLAEPLAAFVAALHAVPTGTVEHIVQRDDYPLSEHLAEAAAGIADMWPYLTNSQRRCVELFLASTPPPESSRRTLCHNDLGAEHILVSSDGASLTGIIDWSDAALADPANDVGRLVRDFGFAVGHTVLRRIGGDEIMLARATFHARCSLLEDLAYGVHTSRPQYVSHALARFSETFS